MIPFKDILLEVMRPNVATTIFAKYGVRNAAHLDKGKLRKYYMALAKKHHSDAGGKDEDMKWINAAYDVLKKNAKDVMGVELKPEDKIVNVEFRDSATQEVLDFGHCNRHEYLEICRVIDEEGMPVEPKPKNNYDRINDTWTTNVVAFYMSEEEYRFMTPYLEPFFKH
jgi:DnaJ-class molecular chaperone